MAVAAGPSRIVDRVFPARMRHVAELRRLGAVIECGDGAVSCAGGATLQGTDVVASDLRASAALILAALAARGMTVVRAIEHLDRGYEQLELKLAHLGARIERILRRSITRRLNTKA
jgi:UDP-N-acetylglucosamine 1-carboxyvinyltransferase